MGDFTLNRPVFLNFCKDALDKIQDIRSFEADQLRVELEVLSQKLETWTQLPNPPDKDRTIAAVMDAYRRAMSLATAEPGTGTDDDD